VLDVALAPRGSIHWARAQEHCIDAVELAYIICNAPDAASAPARRASAAAAMRRHLELARGMVEEHGREQCACDPPGHGFKDHAGRRRCVKCLARSR
jgi:hypothetical protein